MTVREIKYAAMIGVALFLVIALRKGTDAGRQASSGKDEEMIIRPVDGVAEAQRERSVPPDAGMPTPDPSPDQTELHRLAREELVRSEPEKIEPLPIEPKFPKEIIDQIKSPASDPSP